MKWSVLQPYLEKYSLDEAILKAIKEQAKPNLSNLTPINITITETRKGKAIRILYKGYLPEDASEYQINRSINGYAYIYKEEEPQLFKELSKVIKEAMKDAR